MKITKDKKRQVKRSFALLGVLAMNACAEEPGAPQEGAKTGSIGQAITANLPAARSYGDACRLSITSGMVTNEVILFAAGYDVLGMSRSVQASIYLAENSSWVPFTGTTSVPTAVAYLKVVNDPNDPDHSCIAYGGELANGTAQSSAVRLTVSKPTSYHIASTTITNLTARSHFRTMACGTGALIAVNGRSSSVSLNNIQVLKAGASAFTNVTVTGTLRARDDFGLSVVGDGTNKNFVASLGYRYGNATADADVLQFTNADCDAVTVTNLSDVLDTSNMAAPTALSEVEAFETNYSSMSKLSTIKVPGGTDGTSMFDSVSTIVVDMNGTPSLNSKSYTAAALQGAMSRYKLVILSNGDAYISGGINFPATARSFVSKFARGSGLISSPGNLSTAREGHAFISLPTAGKLQAMGGNSGTSVLNSDEELSP